MDTRKFVYYKEPLENNFGLLVASLIMLSCGLMVFVFSGYVLISILQESVIAFIIGSLFMGMVGIILYLTFIAFPLFMIKDVYHEFRLDKDIVVKYTLKKIRVGWDKVRLRYLKDSEHMVLTIEVGNGHSNINKIYKKDDKEFENLMYLANLYDIQIINYEYI